MMWSSLSAMRIFANGSNLYFNEWNDTPASGIHFDMTNAYIYATRVYGAVYNDYAEYFKKADVIEAGDIVRKKKGEDGYIKSQCAYDKLVVGVLSDNYCQVIGGDEGATPEEMEKKYAPIGMAGRVRVKVTGNIEEGDLIVASDIPGVGMASQDYKPGTVVGKALESHTGDQIDRIEMLIINM
jgi:hypothetical protein